MLKTLKQPKIDELKSVLLRGEKRVVTATKGESSVKTYLHIAEPKREGAKRKTRLLQSSGLPPLMASKRTMPTEKNSHSRL